MKPCSATTKRLGVEITCHRERGHEGPHIGHHQPKVGMPFKTSWGGTA